jgi:hypothetical protein
MSKTKGADADMVHLQITFKLKNIQIYFLHCVVFHMKWVQNLIYKLHVYSGVSRSGTMHWFFLLLLIEMAVKQVPTVGANATLHSTCRTLYLARLFFNMFPTNFSLKNLSIPWCYSVSTTHMPSPSKYSWISWPWKWDRYILPKLPYRITTPRCVISQKCTDPLCRHNTTVLV